MKKQRITLIKTVVLFVALFILIDSSPLFAQVRRVIRGSTAAVKSKEILKEKPYEAFKPKPKVEIEREAEKVAPPLAESEKKFFIKKIDVIGNTVLSPKLIDKIVQEYENKELYLQDLMELANKITALYASHGYVTTQAYIPPQRIEEGVATIEVVEGQYGEFDIEGCKYTRRNIVAKRLKKKPNEVFNYKDLRKDLLYLNENPDRSVKAAMVRGQRPRTTDFKITVKDRPPIHLGYEVSNTGDKSSGLWRHTYKLTDTGLFLYDDSFNFRYIHSEHSNIYGIAVNYLLPVNEFGTKLGSSLSHFHSKSGHDFEHLDIKSKSTTYSFFLEHPLFDFTYLSGKIDAGLDVKEARTELLAIRQSRDRLRILKAGLTLDESDKWGRSILRNELNFAPANFLGSTDNITHINDPSRQHSLAPSRLQADGTFVKYNYNFSRINRLPFSSILLFNLQGQATNNLLYSSELYSIGGAYSVRGYASGEALGDYGANASAEVRVPLHFIPQDFYMYGINPRRAIQGACFIDWGFVHSKSPVTTNARPERHNEKLIGAGFGVRANLMNCISVKTDLAWPVGNNHSDYGSESRLHMLFTVEEPTLDQYEAIVEEMMQYRIRSRLNSIAKKVPPDVLETYNKARRLEKEGHYEEAKELYVAVMNRKNEIMANAKTKIRETIEKEEKADSYFKEAEKLYKREDYLGAKELYEKALSLTEKQERNEYEYN